MPTDLDIYRSAKIMIDQYGPDAVHKAVICADELRDRGDPNGQAVWLRIRAAAVELLRVSPLPHHRVN